MASNTINNAPGTSAPKSLLRSFVGKSRQAFIFIFIAFIFLNFLYAAVGEPEGLPWRKITNEFLCFLSLFLFGLELMCDSLQRSAGNKMRSLLAALTKNRFVALFTGCIVTMIIQSSSATTVMLVSFVNAEMMSFISTLGVILGADIGTTITAHLFAFKWDLAIPLIIAGYIVKVLAKNEKGKDVGLAILAFGILFFGMQHIGKAMVPLQASEIFTDFVDLLEKPCLGILFGAIFTALVQSSSATTGVILGLAGAGSGLISIDAAIPITLGANIGTCVTAAISCVKYSRNAKRVALAHIFFKVAGVALFYTVFYWWFPDYFSQFIKYLAETFNLGLKRQIATAHTLFNVGMAIIFLPLLNIFALLIYKIISNKEQSGDPDKCSEEKCKQGERAEEYKLFTWDLDEKLLDVPEFAIETARKRISEIANRFEQMLRAIIIPFISDKKFIRQELKERGESENEINLYMGMVPERDEEYSGWTLLEGIDKREEAIDEAHEYLKNYLIKIKNEALSKKQRTEVDGMVSINDDIEQLADHVHRFLVPLITVRHNLNMDFSEEGKEEQMIFNHKICNQIRRLKEVYAEQDPEKAQRIVQKSKTYNNLKNEFQKLHFGRLCDGREESKETDEVHSEFINTLGHINMLIANIADTIDETWLNPKGDE